jgi:hypothetical protein
MRVPSFERFRRISAAGAFFACGAVVGAAVWSGLASEQMNQVILRNIELKEQIDNYQEELSRMQSDSEKGSIIQSILIFVEEPAGKDPLDAVTERELKKRIRDDLSGFRGRRVYNIGKDAQFARSLFENKIYSGIGDNDYEVRISTMLVADGVLQVWVQAKVHLRP